MPRRVLALPILILAVISWISPQAAGQDTKTARGTVTAVAPTSVSVKAGNQEMKFTVDPNTEVTAAGAGTATRKAAAVGKGVTLPELIKVGEDVEVRYHEMAGAMHATSIRRVSDAGSGGVSTSRPQAVTADGTVESVSGKLLIILGSGSGGATSKQTFVVDSSTKVVGVGAGTATAAAGGKVAITDLVGKGDRVTVTYRKMGDALQATEILVRTKAK